MTHQAPDEPSRWPRTRFTPDVASAVATAKEIAGEKDVVIASGGVAGQALDLGLVDEIAVSLVPMLMGAARPTSVPCPVSR